MRIQDFLNVSLLPLLDAEVLLAHVLGKTRTWVIAHANDAIDDATIKSCRELSSRREEGEPLAYITGKKEFYGREFSVDQHVLIPRPSTEALIDVTVEFMKHRKVISAEIDSGISGLAIPLRAGEIDTIIDVGCGSGCIAVTLALEITKQNILALDASNAALEIARRNIETHKVSAHVHTILGDGPSFVATFQSPFLIVSNPPYIPSSEHLESSVVMYEPHEALFAGVRGLDVLLPLTRAARDNSACIGIILELRNDQVQEVRDNLSV
jgi:release factor glutamine methyltransferase